MNFFVPEGSIVRKIWGRADTILFIFAGGSAEFALNKAVDWLYYTGKLPGDPLGRLFSTVAYAQQIVFADYDAALAAIDRIAGIHKNVEQQRGAQIPAWAYRDVLFMLIAHSIRAFELLERRLTTREKQEAFAVFYAIGVRMRLEGLPTTFDEWQTMREQHLNENLVNGHFTKDLYKQYRQHLGFIRYQLLKQVQVMVAPKQVRQLRLLNSIPLLWPVLQVYKFARKIKIDGLLKKAILPNNYKLQIQKLDVV